MKMLKYGVALAVCWGQVAQADFEEPDPGPSLSSPRMERNWSASARGYVGYGDNIALVADNDPFPSEKSSAFIGGSLEGTKTLYDMDGWTVGISGRLDAIRYLEDGDDAELDEYSTVAAGAAIFGGRDFMAGSMPMHATVAYDFHTEDAGDVEAIGLDAHRVTAGVAGEISETVTFDVAVSISEEDYEVDFSNMTLNDRDSTRTTVSAGVEAELADGDVVVEGRYRYTDNDADGSNWAYTGHKVSGAVSTQLSDHVFGRLAASYEARDYDGFQSFFIPSPGRTEQDVTAVTAQAVAFLTDHVSVDAYAVYESYESDSAFFEGDDARFGVGVTYSF